MRYGLQGNLVENNPPNFYTFYTDFYAAKIWIIYDKAH